MYLINIILPYLYTEVMCDIQMLEFEGECGLVHGQ